MKDIGLLDQRDLLDSMKSQTASQKELQTIYNMPDDVSDNKIQPPSLKLFNRPDKLMVGSGAYYKGKGRRVMACPTYLVIDDPTSSKLTAR